MMEFDTKEWREFRDEKLREWLLGNEHAVQVVRILGETCEVWDDLVDQDKPVTTGQVNEAFINVFVRLAGNPFWNQAKGIIEPVFIIGINAWLDANEFEESCIEKERQLAFFIRDYYAEIAQAAVLAVGGWDHLRSVSAEMRRVFSHDSYAEWEHKLEAVK